MNKIPTIFFRDMANQPALVIDLWTPGTEWVRDGEGIATRKYDGTAGLVRDGKLYKRREARCEDRHKLPPDFELVEEDVNTHKLFGWVPVGEGPEDRWHREAFATAGSVPDGTYELLGPKIQGAKDGHRMHILQPHAGATAYLDAPREFNALRAWLTENVIEGLVWHHDDGRMAKIKRRDFGLKW
jgi:hypothetical protein